jgi:hypothetical protein
MGFSKTSRIYFVELVISDYLTLQSCAGLSRLQRDYKPQEDDWHGKPQKVRWKTSRNVLKFGPSYWLDKHSYIQPETIRRPPSNICQCSLPYPVLSLQIQHAPISKFHPTHFFAGVAAGAFVSTPLYSAAAPTLFHGLKALSLPFKPSSSSGKCLNNSFTMV